MWALTYFSYFVYSLFAVSAFIYVLPNVPSYASINHFSKLTTHTSLTGNDLMKSLLTPLLLMLLVHMTWSGPALTAWFGHLTFSNFQFKLTYLLYFFFSTYLVVLLSTHHASSLNFFDFLITVFNFFVWIWLMCFSNNVFSFIFFLELLSAAVTLLLVTSSFSSSHFYNNLSLSSHAYFNNSTPTAFLQTLMFFFWVTLLSSLTLFVFVITFYLKFFSFDFNLVTSIFTFLLTTSSLKSLFTTSFSWLVLLIAISIKCGLVPFYLWKPSFFKGMTLPALFFYVYVYYFTIFFFFVYVLCHHFHELFTFYLYATLFLVLLATVALISLMFESYYVKAFLALSSILNSTLVLYTLCGFQSLDSLLLV